MTIPLQEPLTALFRVSKVIIGAIHPGCGSVSAGRALFRDFLGVQHWPRTHFSQKMESALIQGIQIAEPGHMKIHN